MKNNIFEKFDKEVDFLKIRMAILVKYDSSLSGIKSSKGLYSLDEAISLIIKSRDVNEEDKVLLRDVRDLELTEAINKVRLEWAPLKEKYSRMETTIEEDEEYYQFQDKISDLKRDIKRLDEIYLYRDYGNILSEAVSKTDNLLKEFKTNKG